MAILTNDLFNRERGSQLGPAYHDGENLWYKKMSGVQLQNASSALAIQGSQKNEGSVIVATGSETKPKKKICCACPDTKKLRDECMVEHGEAACAKWIEAHRLCLRAEGFNV
ncbi:unnamed protein product [Sphenostylis stenocarpa]|uniref:Cytochrome c oxidase copper chaperone n=1 Tax=Sphenostylis stenocarpa TaxID=92480 RepID=A0AA86W4U1_9FABA|nr:unnamed protein product [Sphenostylis stenocarpa]